MSTTLILKEFQGFSGILYLIISQKFRGKCLLFSKEYAILRCIFKTVRIDNIYVFLL